MIERATRERQEARSLRARGVATLAVVPLTASLGVLGVFASVWVAALILIGMLPIQLLAGFTWATRGGLQSHRARRRLGSAASLCALPEARLLE